jgi:lysophospholipase L1-like esterase
VLRASLAERFGAAGTGITIAQHALIDNPSWDSHLDPTGAQRVGMGLHRTGVWKVPTGESTSFVADASEFWVWNLSASGPMVRARINGADVGRMRNVKSDRSDAAEIVSEDGYGGAQMMTRIAAPDGGRNELMLEAEDGHLALLGIEGRVPAKGTWRLTNASINGKALSTLFAGDGNDDTESELFGLGMVDSLRADILIIALGTNDWHGGATKQTIKKNLTTLIRRQRATGTSAAGGALTGGDALLLFNPQPSIDASGYPTYIATAKTPWDEIRAAFHEVSAEQQCELIDLGDLWGGFGKSAELGYMADDLHVSDAGAMHIARAVEDHLFG